MKSFKEYSQEVDEGFMGYQDSSMWSRHRRRVRGNDTMNQHFETEKGNFPERPYRGSYAKHEAKWEAHKEAKRQESLKGKGVIARKVSDVKTALHKKVYGFAPFVKEDAEGLDEGMYLVGTYTNPKKDHVRVWQHSPEGYHYSIENATSKKTITHRGSLDSAVRKHGLELVKEEEERTYAPNVPSHIRSYAEKRRGQHYNYMGKLHRYRTRQYEKDHDDESAIERAAAKRKGW
jgi:hypothetical protein